MSILTLALGIMSRVPVLSWVWVGAHEGVYLDNVTPAGHGVGNPEYQEEGAVYLTHEGHGREPDS